MSRGALFSAAVVPILVALGALISVASASGYSTLVFTGEAINVHGYQMTVSARSGPVGPTSLNVDFFRGRPHRSEEDSYQFSKGVSLKTAKDLSRARLAADLGKLGAIDLVVSESRPTTRHKVPRGCRGRPRKSWLGPTRGTFKLRTRSRFFGTIRRRSLRATPSEGPSFRCNSRLDRPPGEFCLGGRDPRGRFEVLATKTSPDEVTEWFYTHSTLGEALLTHTLLENVSGSAFALAADFTSAHLTGEPPFFGGTADFTPGAVFSNGRDGTLTGSLEAKFDSIGTIELFSGGSLPGFLGTCVFAVAR